MSGNIQEIKSGLEAESHENNVYRRIAIYRSCILGLDSICNRTKKAIMFVQRKLEFNRSNMRT